MIVDNAVGLAMLALQHPPARAGVLQSFPYLLNLLTLLSYLCLLTREIVLVLNPQQKVSRKSVADDLIIRMISKQF